MAAMPSASASGDLLTLSESDVAAVLDDLPASAIVRQAYIVPGLCPADTDTAFSLTLFQLASVGQALASFSRYSSADGSRQLQGDAETPAIQNPLRLSVTTPRHTVLFMPSRLGV